MFIHVQCIVHSIEHERDWIGDNGYRHSKHSVNVYLWFDPMINGAYDTNLYVLYSNIETDEKRTKSSRHVFISYSQSCHHVLHLVSFSPSISCSNRFVFHFRCFRRIEPRCCSPFMQLSLLSFFLLFIRLSLLFIRYFVDLNKCLGNPLEIECVRDMHTLDTYLDRSLC